ncbi:DoxX family protein [Zafaria sp. Z1313]|uniref:DoxX family protein n=1 Tax=unclassified Zafaria TaxID=2828765 RepID=UPI002E75A483|nr:DoxX family protein [Zafaria sp. J156]MEE1622189.1 DoxX family protein [Zafaria sp. J156]
MSPVRAIARPLLASSFIWSGVERLRKPEEAGEQLRPTLRRASAVLPQLREAAEKPALVARVIGGVQVIAGVLFALGRFPRLSASLLVGSSLLASVDGSSPHRTGDRLKNASLAGGVLLASVDTAGQPSIAWRAQHLTADARKQLHRTNKELGRAVKRTAADARKSAESVIGH